MSYSVKDGERGMAGKGGVDRAKIGGGDVWKGSIATERGDGEGDSGPLWLRAVSSSLDG